MNQFWRKSRAVPYLILSFAVASCGGGSNPTGPSQIQPGHPWELKLSSNCNARPLEQCIGGYGFTIDANGKYTVGPGPQGETLTGTISKEKFDAVVKLGNGIEQGWAESSSEQCAARSASNIMEDVLANLSVASADTKIEFKKDVADSRRVVRLSETDLCRFGIAPDVARRLLEILGDLASNYYPLPFPNDSCDAAIGALEALYLEARRCNDSSDCSYVNADFSLVPRDTLKLLTSGDCSGVSPLVAGNRTEVAEKRFVLLDAKTAATEACKKRVLAGGCSGYSEFKATQPEPICLRGVCRAGATEFSF